MPRLHYRETCALIQMCEEVGELDFHERKALERLREIKAEQEKHWLVKPEEPTALRQQLIAEGRIVPAV